MKLAWRLCGLGPLTRTGQVGGLLLHSFSGPEFRQVFPEEFAAVEHVSAPHVKQIDRQHAVFVVVAEDVGIVTFQHKYGQNLNFAVPADWIGDMRTRTSSKNVQQASVTSSRDPTTAEMVVGAWHCFGSLSGRNGEYTFGDDGTLAVVSNDGRNFKTPYRVIGRTVQFALGGQVFSYEIESISQSRMVQVVGGGQRLVCER